MLTAKQSRTTNAPFRLVLVLAVLLPTALFILNQPTPVSAGSCAEDSGNLLKNGMMAPGAPNQYGVVARDWNGFVLANDPVFENAGNEGWDPYGSQYIWADLQTFDAGMYQTVTNLTPGQTYHYWLVWGQTLHDIAGNNVKAWKINRQLGIDLTGGTDPNAPTVLWTVPYWDGGGFNRPEWNLYFTAASSTATLFLRVQNEHTDGRNKVFFDVACLYPASGAATTTPWATQPTPTKTPDPSETPSANSTRYDDAHPSIKYKGAWTQDSDPFTIDSTYHYAQGKKGSPALITFKFTGTQLTIWYVGYKNRGKAKVVVDGVRVGVIDQYTPDVQYNLSRTFGGLADGSHNLKLRNVGAKNPRSVDSIIVLDAVDVTGTGEMGAISKPLAAIPYGTVAAPTPTPSSTPKSSRPQLVPFSPAAPIAPTPDDPSVRWDSRLPELNVYLAPANVAEGETYWKLIRADYHDPFQHCGDFGGDHFMYYVLTDEVGGRVVNQRVWQGWPGDSTSAMSDMRGLANIALWANYFPSNGPGPYSGWVDGLPSDTVRGMGLPANNHVSFVLYFQRTTKSAYTARTATPTGVWSSPTPSRTPTLDCSPVPTVTNTPKGPTRTATPTRTPSFTPTSTYTFTASPSRTNTPTWTLTHTPTVAETLTPTRTSTIANTSSPTRTRTSTPTWTETLTKTFTPTATLVPPNTPTNAACTIGVVATIPLSDSPKGIAVDPSTLRIFVGLAGSSSVAVIDAKTNQVIETWETDGAGSTNGVAFTQGKLFITKRNTASVSVLDATTGSFISNITVGSAPYGIAANNDYVWVANFSDGTVTLIDARTNEVMQTTPVDPNPSLVAALADRAYVSAWNTGVNQLDSSNEIVDTLATGEGTYGIAADANAQRLYVGIRRAKSVLQFDATTGNRLNQTKESFAPFGLTINPATGHLFIVAGNFDLVRVRGRSLQWYGDVKVGVQGTEGGDSLVVFQNRVYVANNSGHSVSVLRDCADAQPVPEPTATAKPTRKPTRTPIPPTAVPTLAPTNPPTREPTATPIPSGKCLRRPKLLAPGANDHITDTSPLLDWSDSKCATSYDLQLRRGNQNGATVVETTTDHSEYQSSDLKRGKAYYFRSRACNGNACSPWARWRVFYVE